MSYTSIRCIPFVAAVAACAAWFAPSPAKAAETGFYVGGFYGLSEKDETRDGFDAYGSFVYDAIGFSPLTSAKSFDTKSNGYGFTGGYRFFQNLALEGGYLSLGTVKYRDRASGNLTVGETTAPSSATFNLDSNIGGIAISALGILPISYRAEVYGRGGIMFSTHKLRLYYADALGSLADEYSESATDFLAGVGVSFMVAEVYALRAEVVRVFDAGDEDNGEGDVDMVTLGVTVKF